MRHIIISNMFLYIAPGFSSETGNIYESTKNDHFSSKTPLSEQNATVEKMQNRTVLSYSDCSSNV